MKLKISKSICKRFKQKKNNVHFKHAFHSHLLTKKSQKLKRGLRKSLIVNNFSYFFFKKYFK